MLLGGFSALGGSESLSMAGKENKKMEEYLWWSAPASKMQKDIKHAGKFGKAAFTE